MSSVKLLFNKLIKLNNIKYYSIKSTSTGGLSLIDSVILSDDKKTFIAWHPNQDYPYEFTRPLPPMSETEESEIIKESAMKTAKNAFSAKKPEIARQQLMNLTYTTKHRWFPRARDKKAKKTPMDRPYL